MFGYDMKHSHGMTWEILLHKVNIINLNNQAKGNGYEWQHSIRKSSLKIIQMQNLENV